MRLAVVAGLGMLLAGCASPQRMASLDSMGAMSYGKNSYGHETLEGVRFSYPPAKVAGDALPLCVAKTVENRAVTLSDTTSRVGPYSGMVYNQRSAREAGGGQVISYVSEDKQTVVATGTTPFGERGAVVNDEQSLTFTLTVKNSTSGATYEFAKLQKAYRDTGAMANEGYQDVGAWSAARPDRAVSALKALADKVSGCLASM